MRQKRVLLLGMAVVVILILCVLSIWFFRPKTGTGNPSLSIERPQKISALDREPFTLDVMLTNLGDTYYPAMSASISFDASHMEFLGIEEGNVFVRDNENPTEQKLPAWSCNIEQCNKTGLIQLMYLDLTGGKYSFEQSLLTGTEHVLLRLKFRLRGSVRSGEVYELIFEDAVFAASDETKSLASSKGTLRVRNSKIVIGE